MTDWPSTLPPSPLIEGLNEEGPEQALRSENSIGPAKVRRRSTGGVRAITWPLLLTTEQVTILENFIDGDIGGGTLPFNLLDPRTNTVRSFRLVSRPQYSLISHRHWRTNLSLEQLPTGASPEFLELESGDKLLLE